MIDNAGNVDDSDTAARRRAIRKARKRWAETKETRTGAPCATCGSTEGFGLVRRPLRHAGPLIALRYGGDGPNFEIEETICRGCGALADVREVMKAGHEPA